MLPETPLKCTIWKNEEPKLPSCVRRAHDTISGGEAVLAKELLRASRKMVTRGQWTCHLSPLTMGACREVSREPLTMAQPLPVVAGEHKWLFPCCQGTLPLLWLGQLTVKVVFKKHKTCKTYQQGKNQILSDIKQVWQSHGGSETGEYERIYWEVLKNEWNRNRKDSILGFVT